jgi:vacuolar protein sorting-associated protein 13A/C
MRCADRLGKQSYMGAIVSKVVDNVQIHVKNIHMRYEDGSSTPEVSYARRLEDKLR